MKFALAILLTLYSISTVAANEGVVEEDYYVEYDADLVVNFDPVEGTFDLGIKRMEEDGKAHFTLWLKKEQLVQFFDAQKQKEHIGIIFIKRWVQEPKRRAILTELRDFFLERGYKRITVQQYFSSRRGTWLDYRAEQDGADRLATAPDSKPEGNENSKPESEGRPQ